MTRNYLQTVHCQHCGKETSTETAFGRWFRRNKKFESKDGHVMYDPDFIRHRYKFDHDRTVQYIMFIEIKTHGARPDKAQKDTEHIIHQFLSNRKINKTIQVSEPRPNCVSTMTGKLIRVRAFGYHLLRFQNTGPLDGWIMWDRDIVSIEMLEKILNFDVDPKTFKPMDNRSRHWKHPEFHFEEMYEFEEATT